jgi:hypothetical protein
LLTSIIYMRNLFICVLFVCSYHSFAQAKPIMLNGTINLNTGESFPYKLVLTETDGAVKGYSITYNAPDDTKTLIRGTLDRRSHTLSFKETEIAYSHTYHTQAYMCLIDAKLSYATATKGSMLKGAIISMEADKTSCTGGTIQFTTDEEIQNLFAYHDKLDTMITMHKKVKEPAVEIAAPLATIDPLVTDKVTAGMEKAYDWYTDTAVIDVWDGGNIDGDRITLLFNGQSYLTAYYLVKEKKQLHIPLAPGVNTLTIIADNEGSDPPNTASMLLTDGRTKYSVLAYNNKGQKCIIKIRRVK